MKGRGKLLNIFKESASAAGGAILGMIPQLLIGSVILILGIYLIQNDDKKKIKQNNSTHGYQFYLGMVLVVLGSVISFNMMFGIEFIMSEMSN